MARSTHAPTWIVLAIALSMLTITLPAMATHNSVGADVTLTTATEVGDEGTLQPDIPHPDHPNVADSEDPNPYLINYHDELDEPRPSPVDQVGDRYTDCTTEEEAGDNYDPSNNVDQCYVGYLDHRWMVWAGHLLLTMQPDDDLYAVNPNDDYCRGSEDTEETTGVGPVDELATRADRAVNDPECQGGGHGQALPGAVTIDVNLLAAPVDSQDEGAGTPGVADVTRSDTASGSQPFPTIVTPYYFLFGQPHEDNENPSQFEAGSGPFGPDPAAGGNPLHDISGVCGDRTEDCRLLTPTDLKLYDPYKDLFVEEGEETEQARFCSFSPQFSILNPDERDAGLCGVNGDVVNQFTQTTELGGLGVEEAPPTWVSNLPGWYQGVLSLTQTGELGVRGGGGLADVATGVLGSDVTVETAAAAASHDGDGMRSGVDHYSAVNPLVPDEADHPLWCVSPNFLMDGDDTKASTGSDPGVYGERYVADAIDVDVYVSPFHDQYQAAISTSQDAGITSTTPDEIHVANVFDTLDDQEEFARNQLPDPVREVVDRADYQEDPNDADVVDLSSEYTFSSTREAGLSCNDLGLIEDLETSETVQGGLAFDTSMSHTADNQCVAPIGIPTGVCTPERALKDPTLLDEDGLPEEESDTERGAWQPDSYGFGGTITAFLDTSTLSDGTGDEFNGCAPATGAASPEDDRCVWRGLWDAYNPECTNIGSEQCSGILEGMGYDLDTGVGLYAVAEVTGPVATYSVTDNVDRLQDRTSVLGLEDPTATNCIVALSFGFQDKLDDILGTDDLENELCGHVDGETHLITDGFGDQSAVSPGGFSSAFSIAKLTPTPDEAGIGQDDEVCVTGIWSVQDGVTSTSDTEGNLELDSGQHEWSDCFEFAPN